jgi:serine/threonine protein kinase
VVAGYHLEARLGKGGQGTVYRALREGRQYAVKFLYLPRMADWAWRELDVMVRLRRAGVLPLEGCGKWPAGQPRFLFIVTPYVRGRSLYDWAREHNPTAREVAWLVREVARQLAAVHRAGVVHRDVKGDNLLVRREDGRPVLVDFGVGTYEGAPPVTPPLVLPGTPHYRSPEALRFRREHVGEHAPARASDDLWALGVVLYWLLTGGYPFDTEAADEGALADVILRQEPEAPHASNPRAPRALSELCLRMLRKEPGERHADAAAVDAALGAALEEADEAWEVPLCEARSPSTATPVGEVEGDDAVDGEREEAAEEPPPAPETRPTPHSRRALWTAGAALVLGLAVWLTVHPPPRASAPTLSLSRTPEATPPPESFPVTLESGQELAPPWRPPEGGGGAAPEEAATPAPVASATRSEEDIRVKTARKAPAAQQEQQPRETGTPAGKAGTALVICALASGCPSPSTLPQARPLPPPTECPPGAVRAMKELGIPFGRRETRGIEFIGEGPQQGLGKLILVREGPGTRVIVDQTGTKLPRGTILFGELFLSEERVYGRFTKAHTPGGHTYPVCMVLTDRSARVGALGSDVRPSEEPGTFRLFSLQRVQAVERFE